MPITNPFPLQIVPKVNDPKILELIQQFGHQYYLDANDVKILTDALNFLFEKSNISLVDGFYAGSLNPTDDAPAITGSFFGLAIKPGTYANFNNVVLLPNSIGVISKDSNGNITLSQTEIELGDYIKQSDLETSAYGFGSSYAAVSNTTIFICNVAPLTSSRKISNLVVNSPNNGTIEIYLVNAGLIPIVDNAITKTLITTVNTIAGINNIALNINGVPGDMIGIKNISGGIGYTDGGVNKYFDASFSNIAGLNPGFIAYYFESFASEEFANLAKVQRTSKIEVEESLSKNKVFWIDLKGQSNALGVGYASGLTAEPYSLQPFDWTKELSRCFIWNPLTDAFENIRIGVNNMASWDENYTIAAPTAFPTFGSEVAISLAFLQSNKTGELYIFKNVGDSQAIAYFQKETTFYDEYLIRKQKAENWLAARGKEPIKIASVFIQGEADFASLRVDYFNALKQLNSDMVADGFITEKSIIVQANIPAGTANYSAEINLAKDDYVAFNKFARTIFYTNNFNPDNLHLNTTGQILLGLHAYQKIFQSELLTPETIWGKSNWNNVLESEINDKEVFFDDIVIANSDKGLIIKDRGNGTFKRLVLTNGVISFENI